MNDQDRDNDQSFKQLLSESRFDDSVDQYHQRELRLQALQAFDQSQHETKVTPVERLSSANQRRSRTGVRLAAFAAVIAVCLVAVASLWNWNTEDNSRLVTVRRLVVEPTLSEDNSLADALTEISKWQSEGSSDVFFQAMEISRQENAARQLEQKSAKMRFFAEISQ